MATIKLVIGNWKMNPQTWDDAKRISRKMRSFARRLRTTSVVICPPLPFLPAARFKLQPETFHLGAQSASVDESGAHTGEVTARMLASLDVEYVIAGHSEERAAGDTDEMVSQRIARILEAGLVPVVCVGEMTREESGAHLEFLRRQITASLAGIPADKARRIILAYEPIWAIGAKEAMKPEDIYEMSLFVKKAFADLFGTEAGLKVRVLYGGSVHAKNAADIMKIGKVDGLLVGRESVNPPGFLDLLKAVDTA